MPHDPSSNHLRRVYVRRNGSAASSRTGWRKSEPSDGRTILTCSSTEVMDGIPQGSKSIEMTWGMSWRTSRIVRDIGFWPWGPGYSNYETVEFLNGRRSLLGEGYPRVRNKSPQELSTGLSTNWGQLTWM